MPNPTNIPILPENISITGTDTVALHSHTLKSLASKDPKLATDLLNENGFTLDPTKITWAHDGTVTIKDILVKDKLDKTLKNKNMAALNICGLCKVE